MSIQQMPDTAAPEKPDHLRRLYTIGRHAQNDLTARFLAAGPFADRARYGRFLTAQHRVTRELEAAYSQPLRLCILPSLTPTGHLSKIEDDLRDLGLTPSFMRPLLLPAGISLSTAELCGVLFVAEGVRLMFPYFRKQAERLGFHADVGARHLAYDSFEIRERWKGFVATVNGMTLSARDVLIMAAASEWAMQRIRTIINDEMSRSRFTWRGEALYG